MCSEIVFTVDIAKLTTLIMMDGLPSDSFQGCSVCNFLGNAAALLLEEGQTRNAGIIYHVKN